MPSNRSAPGEEHDSERDMPFVSKRTLELDSHRPLTTERYTEPPSELRRLIHAGLGTSPLSRREDTFEKEDRVRVIPGVNQRLKASETGRQPRQIV